MRTQSGSKKAKMGFTKNVLRVGGECSLGFGFMALHVKSEMVGTGEAPLADFTFERLGSSVFSYMPSELIGSSKAPLAVLEMTFVWFLTCVNSLVSFQM